jgi:hypothetical protein
MRREAKRDRDHVSTFFISFIFIPARHDSSRRQEYSCLTVPEQWGEGRFADAKFPGLRPVCKGRLRRLGLVEDSVIFREAKLDNQPSFKKISRPFAESPAPHRLATTSFLTVGTRVDVTSFPIGYYDVASVSGRNPVWAIRATGVQLYFRNNRGISGLPRVRLGKRSPSSRMSRSTGGSLSSRRRRGNRMRKICLENCLSKVVQPKTACPLPAFCEPVRRATQVFWKLGNGTSFR